MNDPPDKNQPNPKLAAVAFHEAGHAVVAISLGRLLKKVTIQPGRSQSGGARLGVCEMRKGRSKASKNEWEDDVLILFAGMVAESNFTGEYCKEGAGQDLRVITRMLQDRTNSEKQLERAFSRLLDKTEHLLADEAHAHAVNLVAEELIQRKSISGRAVRHFFEQAVKKFS